MANRAANKANRPPSSELEDFFDTPKYGPTKWPEAIADWVRLIFIDAPLGPGRWAELTPEERRAAVAKFENEWSFKKSPALTMAWFDATLDAEFWWQRTLVSPHEAALLLCQFNPLDGSCDPLNTTNDQTGPAEYERLLRAFAGPHSVAPAARCRCLQDWLRCAQDEKLKYHSWIDVYGEARTEGRSQPQSPLTGLTTRQIADIFGRFVTINLKGAMDDGAKWIVDGRLQRGTAGGRHKALWDPVIVATALLERNYVPAQKLNKAFADELVLKRWRDKWLEYSTM